MKQRFIIGVAFILCLVSGPGCSRKEENAKPNEKTAERPPVAVEVMNITATDIAEGIDVVGSLSPKFSADVKSEYVGVVTEIHVAEWVRVRKGAPLASIDRREMEIIQQKNRAAVETVKANLLQAEVGGNRADREYGRLLKLKEFGLVTQQSLDEGSTDKEASVARIKAAQAQLKAAEEELSHTQTKLSKTVIRSPMDGVVSLRTANVGDLVGEPGAKVMFRLIDTRVLELTVAVPSAEMGKIRIGQSLSFSTDVIPGKSFTGKIMFINPVVTEADRSVKVVAEVDNTSEQLKGGLYAKGKIITGKRTGVLQVSRAALLSWDVAGKKGELFIVNGEIARRRSVQTGALLGDLVEITSGLTSEDPVVIRGGFNLKEGDRVTMTHPQGG